MVQSVIQWGKNPVVVIKQQDDHVKSVKKSKPQNAKDGSTKRKSRQHAKDDRLLIKKLKEDDAMAVRSDRQQSELRALNAGTISSNYNNIKARFYKNVLQLNVKRHIGVMYV